MNDAMDAPVRNGIRDAIRANPTRLDYNGREEYYLENHDAGGSGNQDPNDPGDGGGVTYGVPTDLLDNLEIYVDYMAEGENAPLPVLDRLLRGAIRAPDSMYRKWDILAEAWTEAPEGENCMVTQLFQAVKERVHTGSQKRDSNGAFVGPDADKRVRRPKYSMEEWCTLTHDVELAVHPETPLFKDGQAPNETELSQILWLRRMERQPELAAQLDEIAKWLHDLLLKKGEKDIRGIVRAIQTRCNTWFEVLQRRWPQHKDRNGSVAAFVQSRPFMFRRIVERPTNIPASIPKQDKKLYDEKLKVAAQENYRPIAVADFVDSWERGQPFFDKTWKEVGVSTAMVYCIADRIRVGVMVMQDDILVAKHWPEDKKEPEPEQWVGYNVWGDHGFFYTSETVPHLARMRVQPAKKVPEKRLVRIQDDRERTHFENIDWYELATCWRQSNSRRPRHSRRAA